MAMTLHDAAESGDVAAVRSMARADYHSSDFIPTARKGQFQGVCQARHTTAPLSRCCGLDDALQSRLRRGPIYAATLAAGSRSQPTVPRGWMSTPQRVRGQGRW